MHVLECMFPDDVAVYQMSALKGPAADGRIVQSGPEDTENNLTVL